MKEKVLVKKLEIKGRYSVMSAAIANNMTSEEIDNLVLVMKENLIGNGGYLLTQVTFLYKKTITGTFSFIIVPDNDFSKVQKTLEAGWDIIIFDIYDQESQADYFCEKLREHSSPNIVVFSLN